MRDLARSPDARALPLGSSGLPACCGVPTGASATCPHLQPVRVQSQNSHSGAVACGRGGHSDDVFDLAWAPDASALLSGSIENICVLWDVDAGRSRLRLENHSHFVQGVAWDPARQYVVSQSADRSCRCGLA